MTDRSDSDLIRRLTEYLHGYSTYPSSGEPSPQRPPARGHRAVAFAATGLVAVLAAAVIVIGFAAGHGNGGSRHPLAAIPSATGTASPAITAAPSGGLTTPSTGPTATPTVAPTPASTPTPGQVGSAVETYRLPSPGEGQQVNAIIAGPNGETWFGWGTPSGTVGGIGSVTTGGAISLFPASEAVEDLTSGGGYLWTLEAQGDQSYIGRWTTAGTLQQQFPIPGVGSFRLVWGPDGALWFTAVTTSAQINPGGFIGRMTTAGAVTTYQLPASLSAEAAQTIVVGPDGALWFDVPMAASIGRITMAGTVSVYPIPNAMNEGVAWNDHGLTVGPDGALWETWAANNELVRIAVDGSMEEFPLTGCATAGAGDITAGPDGNLWVTVQAINAPAVCSVSTAGTVGAVYPLTGIIPANTYPTVGASGPDGDLWFGVVLGDIASLDPSIPLS